jgi:hypothetical protein
MNKPDVAFCWCASPSLADNVLADTMRSMQLRLQGSHLAHLHRCSAATLQGQALFLQMFTACIRVCDSVTLLQKAEDWGCQLAEALRKAAATLQKESGTANGTSTATADPAAASATLQASCAAATELCSRLQQYIDLPAVRREVSGVATKLLQPLVAVLDSSCVPDSVLAGALQLLAALLRCVPTSVRPILSNVERVLQQLVVRSAGQTAGSSVSAAGGPLKQQLLAQAAVCAALLPGVSADAAAWSEAARKLLVSCHEVLDYLLMGLEGRPVDPHNRSTLASAQQQQQGQQQAGQASGGWLANLPMQQQAQEQQSAVMRRQTAPAMLLASFCLTALQQLLQQPAAVPVPVPAYSLAMLAARLQHFDAAAAVAAGAVPGSSTMYQELLVLQPQLQLAGWQLLQQVIRSCGQQLQLQGVLLRLVRQGLRAVQLSGPAALQQQPVAVRCCMYEAAVQLLQATGLAGARSLAAEAMGCVVLELYGQTLAAASKPGAAAAGQQRPVKRARKSGGASGGELGQFDPAAAVAAAAADDSVRLATATAASLQAHEAALRMLKGLLAVGGQVLPAEVRAHADAVAYHISLSVSQVAVQLEQQPALSAAAAAGSGAMTAVQVAAYEVLLASVLVPCSHRPPFLSQAVLLLRQGRSSSNAVVAAVCQSAALQLEVLMHPRAAAMGGVRQYTGMEAVPPLARPCMWDVFSPQEPVQQQQGGVTASAGDAAAASIPMANGGPGALAGGAGVQPAAAGGPQSSGLVMRAGGHNAGASEVPAAVVMGYPVNGQPAAGQDQSSQQQQQQQIPMQPVVQQQLPQLSQKMTIEGNAASAGVQAPAGVPSTQATFGAEAMAIDAQQAPMQQSDVASDVVTQQQQQHQQQLQQQQGQGLAAWPAVQGASKSAERPAAAASTKAPAAPAFEDESSDSEGPLPDIDSGAGSSEEDE